MTASRTSSTGTVATPTRYPLHQREALRVKRASLALEATYLQYRRQALKRRAAKAAHRGASAARGESLWAADHLHRHQQDVIRPEARAAHLAHAFLTGRALASVEAPGSSPAPLKRAADIARRFSTLTWDPAAWEAWVAAGTAVAPAVAAGTAA